MKKHHQSEHRFQPGVERLEDIIAPAGFGTYTEMAVIADRINGDIQSVRGTLGDLDQVLMADPSKTAFDGKIASMLHTLDADLLTHAHILNERDTAETMLQAMTGSVNTLSISAARANEALTGAERALTAAKEDATKRGADLQALDTLLTTVRQTKAQLTTDMAALQKSLDAMNAKIAATKPPTASQQRTMTSLRSDITKLEQQLTVCKPAQKPTLQKQLISKQESLRKLDIWTPMTVQKTSLTTQIQAKQTSLNTIHAQENDLMMKREAAAGAYLLAIDAVDKATVTLEQRKTESTQSTTAYAQAKQQEAALQSSFTSLEVQSASLPAPDTVVRQRLMQTISGTSYNWTIPDTLSTADAVEELFLALADEVNPETQKTLEAIARGNRLSAALAIPTFEEDLSTAKALVAIREEDYRVIQISRRYNYVNDGDVLLMEERLNNAKRKVTQLENAILAAKEFIAQPVETLPNRNTVTVVGVNHNKLVLQVYAPKSANVQAEISMQTDRHGLVNIERTPAVTSDGRQTILLSVPFHGTMNGMASPQGSQVFRVSVLVDGKRIEEDILNVRWYPESRAFQLHAESFPHLREQTPKTIKSLSVADITSAKAESDALVQAVAPHLDPIIVNEPAILQNVPWSIWTSIGLPSFTVDFLEKSRAELIQKRYWDLIAQGWKPGEVEWDNAWKEVCQAADSLQKAVADYHALLLRKDAGYEPGHFDFKRFDKAYPGFPAASLIKELVETRCADATQALLQRKEEQDIYQERQRFLSGQRSTPPPGMEGLTDAAFHAYVRTLAVGYGDTADGGIGKILAYIHSVGRTMSTTELAVATGRSPEYVMAMGGNYAPSTLIVSLPSTGMGEGPVAMAGTPDWLTSTAGKTSLTKLRGQELSIADYTYEEVHSPLLSLYTDRDTETYPIFGGKIVRDDTVIGRIFSGLHQQLFFKDENIRIRLIAQAEKILGIRAERLLHAVQSGDYMKLEAAMNAEFIAAGYGHIFVEPGAVPQKNSEPTVAAVRTDHSLYTNANPNIRVTFDITLPQDKLSEGSYFTSGNVYLVDGSNPNIQLGDALIAANFSHTYSITVPIASFKNASINNIIGGNYRLKLGLFEKGKIGGMSGAERISPAFFVNVDLNALVPQNGNSLSTLPEGDPNKKLAEEALQKIFQRPPVNLDAGNWYINLGSGAHDGNGYESSDINLSGSLDQNQPVYASEKGTIISKGNGTDTWNTIVLEHTGIHGKWYTQYLHMTGTGQRDINGNVTPFNVGDIVEKNDILGLISDVGSKNQFHLHFEVNLTGYFGMGIDSRKLFEQLGMEYKATAYSDENQNQNGPPQQVIWLDALSAFVTANPNKPNEIGGNYLIYDRIDQVAQTPGASTPTFWRAYEEGKTIEQMTRVVWKNIRYAGETVPSFRWVDESNEAREWYKNPDGKFSFIYRTLLS